MTSSPTKGSYLTDIEAENARLEAEKAKVFGCITITLIKADHPNPGKLPAVFPGNGADLPNIKAPYENCPAFRNKDRLSSSITTWKGWRSVRFISSCQHPLTRACPVYEPEADPFLIRFLGHINE
jgi:hypothetical protein